MLNSVRKLAATISFAASIALMASVASVLVLGTAAFVKAQTASPVDLTPEQENAIYAELTEGLRERNPPEIRIGDELPWWAEVRTLPDLLQLKSVKGFLYAILLIRSASGLQDTVFLVDPSTKKVVRIIRKPLTFKF